MAHVDLACPDWRTRLRTGRSLVPTLPITPDGDRAVAIFNKLRLADVPGTPTMAEAAGDWFREIVRAILGCVDPKTRERLVRELFLLVPKKNSKTTNGALLMVTALLMNERPHANFILTAPVQDVTEIAFAAAAGAIGLDPVLEKKLHVRDHLKTIIHRETKAELQIMTFDPAVLTGQKPSGGVLIDELHVVAKMSKAASAIRQLRGGMIPFPESFLAFISTQSEEQPTGVFKDELTKAREIRDGKRTGAMLPVLYEMPREMQDSPDEWQNPANWPMVTPNAGRSISVARLVEEFETARATSDAELRAWASQHLNLEIGLALGSDRWVGADYWEKAAVPRFTLAELIARCEVIDVGIDGGGLDDLLGFAALGRLRGSREWLLWNHAWAHPSVLERRKAVASRLRDFERDGDLTIVERIGDDIEQVAELVSQIARAPRLDRVGVDDHGLGGILEALEARHIPKDAIIAIPQGWKMIGAIKTAERRLAVRAEWVEAPSNVVQLFHEGGMSHGGQPLMAWCVGNAKVEPKGNAIAITKQAAGFAKIDPLMATFNAVSLLALNPAAVDGRYAIGFV